MNLRRATAADLKPLVALMRGEFTRMEIPTDMTEAKFRRLASLYGVTVLEDGGKIVAGLWATSFQSAEGKGYEVVAIAIDYTLGVDEVVRFADALCLFSLNRAIHDGGKVIRARWDTRVKVAYARDFLGMEETGRGTDPNTGQTAVIHQQGDAQAIIERIIERRPQWRLSL